MVGCHIWKKERRKNLSFEFYFVEDASEHEREKWETPQQPDSNLCAFAVILEMRNSPHFEHAFRSCSTAAGRLLIKFFVWLLFPFSLLFRDSLRDLFLAHIALPRKILCGRQFSVVPIQHILYLAIVALCVTVRNTTHTHAQYSFLISKERQIHDDIKRNMRDDQQFDAAIAIA